MRARGVRSRPRVGRISYASSRTHLAGCGRRAAAGSHQNYHQNATPSSGAARSQCATARGAERLWLWMGPTQRRGRRGGDVRRCADGDASATTLDHPGPCHAPRCGRDGGAARHPRPARLLEVFELVRLALAQLDRRERDIAEPVVDAQEGVLVVSERDFDEVVGARDGLRGERGGGESLSESRARESHKGARARLRHYVDHLGLRRLAEDSVAPLLLRPAGHAGAHEWRPGETRGVRWSAHSFSNSGHTLCTADTASSVISDFFALPYMFLPRPASCAARACRGQQRGWASSAGSRSAGRVVSDRAP